MGAGRRARGPGEGPKKPESSQGEHKQLGANYGKRVMYQRWADVKLLVGDLECLGESLLFPKFHLEKPWRVWTPVD
jgi:hypothetical protein